MITAEQAKTIATSPKTRARMMNKALKLINKYIKQAARRGETSLTYVTNFKCKKEIVKKLQEVGYRVQDGYSCGVIEISWS